MSADVRRLRAGWMRVPPAVDGVRSVDSPMDTRARGRSAFACRVDVVAVDAPVSGSSLLRAGRKPRPIDGHTRGDLHRRPVSAEVRLLRAGRTLQALGPWPRRIYQGPVPETRVSGRSASAGRVDAAGYQDAVAHKAVRQRGRPRDDRAWTPSNDRSAPTPVQDLTLGRSNILRCGVYLQTAGQSGGRAPAETATGWRSTDSTR